VARCHDRVLAHRQRLTEHLLLREMLMFGLLNKQTLLDLKQFMHERACVVI
jgi:hypothetical protein